MDEQSERMIEVYTEWLNRHMVANASPGWDESPITRADYDEWDDPPRLLAQNTILPGTIYERTILVLLTNPFHDEGGPAILTGFFGNDGELEAMLQYFDTDDNLIYRARNYDPASLPEEA